jgi:two-component system chemotaxis response regulator CheB
MDRRLRVLVVDDSALARQIIKDSLKPFPEIEVVATAPDARGARDKLLALEPDVMTLDLEMPGMDGLTFLRLVMKHHPLPVVILSSITAPGSAQAIQALEAGAVEVLGKPGGAYSADEDGQRLAEKIKAAAQAQVRRIDSSAPSGVFHSAPALAHAGAAGLPLAPAAATPRAVLLMGASTGGTEALRTILTALPGALPGVCIAQHIQPHFSRAFAERLDGLCQMRVREAVTGDRVAPGLALVAPGGHHLCLHWQGTHYEIEINDGPAVHHQRPAVDVLFASALKAGAAPYAAAVLLTGMGTDGALGLLALRNAGAHTIVQDEASSVVYGMPREAVRLGAACQVVPLRHIAAHLLRFCSSLRAHPASTDPRLGPPPPAGRHANLL